MTRGASKRRTAACTAIAFAISSPIAAHADESSDAARRDTKATAGAEVDLQSRFIWRGQALSNGPVAQPSAWAGAERFQAIVWTTLLLTDEPPHRVVRSVVPSLSYTFSWDRLSVEPGVIYYWIGDEASPRSTGEAFVNAGLAFGHLRVVSESYVDVKDYPGAYFGTLGPQYETSIDRWSFKASADVGWATAASNSAYFGVDAAALDLVEAGAEVRWDFTDNLYVTLHGEASALIAANLRRSVNDPELVSIGTAFGAEL
jgi:hypothetical protein